MSFNDAGVHVFDTREGFVKYLSEQLRDGGGANRFREELASTLTSEFETFDEGEARPKRQRGMILRNRRWVIRNDDLNLLKSVCEGLTAAAAAGFFIHLDPLTGTGAAVTALVGIGVSLVQFVRQVRKKGAALSAEGINILCVLKSRQAGLSLGEVTKALNEIGDKINKVWTEEEVRKELQRLEKVPLHDGSLAALVGQDADGFWTVSGV